MSQKSKEFLVQVELDDKMSITSYQIKLTLGWKLFDITNRIPDDLEDQTHFTFTFQEGIIEKGEDNAGNDVNEAVVEEVVQ